MFLVGHGSRFAVAKIRLGLLKSGFDGACVGKESKCGGLGVWSLPHFKDCLDNEIDSKDKITNCAETERGCVISCVNRFHRLQCDFHATFWRIYNSYVRGTLRMITYIRNSMKSGKIHSLVTLHHLVVVRQEVFLG